MNTTTQNTKAIGGKVHATSKAPAPAGYGLPYCNRGSRMVSFGDLTDAPITCERCIAKRERKA